VPDHVDADHSDHNATHEVGLGGEAHIRTLLPRSPSLDLGATKCKSDDEASGENQHQPGVDTEFP
jgi:hypothetical protein